jgi:hypothetical protein
MATTATRHSYPVAPPRTLLGSFSPPRIRIREPSHRSALRLGSCVTSVPLRVQRSPVTNKAPVWHADKSTLMENAPLDCGPVRLPIRSKCKTQKRNGTGNRDDLRSVDESTAQYDRGAFPVSIDMLATCRIEVRQMAVIVE